MAIDLPSLLNALRHVVGDADGTIALHEPHFVGREWEYVKDCLDTGWVSSVGSYVDSFERRLAETCGVRHAVAVVNGTAALHVTLLAAGVRPDDEVLMPALTFIATANAAAHCGAIPHFIDSEPGTLGADPERLAGHLATLASVDGEGCRNRRTGRRIAALVPMHVFGHPVDMDPLLEVAGRFGIPVIEDAAEALGSRYKGRSAGSLGMAATLSFNGNKILTTGGGGAVLTDDSDFARRVKHLSTTAKRPHRWAFEHDEIGFNYRLPNLNAALGCAQIEQLPRFVMAKRALARAYTEALDGLDGLHVFQEQGFAQSNYWLNAILLDEAESFHRDDVLTLTNEHGIMTRPAWTLIHQLPMYANCPRMALPVAEGLERRLINLPSSVTLGERHAA